MGITLRLQQAIQNIREKKDSNTVSTDTSKIQSKTESTGVRIFKSISNRVEQISNRFSFHTNRIQTKSNSEKNINKLAKDTLHIDGHKETKKEVSYADKLAKNLNGFFTKKDISSTASPSQTSAVVKIKPPDPKNMEELKAQIEERIKELETPKMVFDKKANKMKPEYVTPKMKEELRLNKALKNQIENEPQTVQNNWEKGKTDTSFSPLYSQMGAVRFLSILAKIEESKISGKGKSEGLSVIQEAALMGYTTDDYGLINPNMRKAEGVFGNIEDKAIASYAKTLSEAHELLPNMNVPPEGLELKRGMNIPIGAPDDWAEKLFQKGGLFADSTFTSTSYSSPPGAQIIITYLPPKGATEFVGAKLIEDSYSVWPGEKEGLISPNTPFRVEEFKKDSSGNIAVTLRGVEDKNAGDKALWRHAGIWIQDVKKT